MKMGKKVAVLGAAVMLTFNMSIGASRRIHTSFVKQRQIINGIHMNGKER